MALTLSFSAHVSFVHTYQLYWALLCSRATVACHKKKVYWCCKYGACSHCTDLKHSAAVLYVGVIVKLCEVRRHWRNPVKTAAVSPRKRASMF